MIQYLQSWFPGWGGWYGETRDLEGGAEELLPGPETWEMLGESPPLEYLRNSEDTCNLLVAISSVECPIHENALSACIH